jgi:hypothetical protein
MSSPNRRALLTQFGVMAGASVLAVSPASAQRTRQPRRPVRRVFDGWAGPAIPVWSHRPVQAGPGAPVLFIMHGVGRDADRYLAEWQDLADRVGFIAVCPEFSTQAFPGAINYNLGGVLDAAGQPRPASVWSYSAIAPIFDWFRAQEQLETDVFDLFGHSAGAQFAHRFRAFAAPSKLRRVIAANAGWYTFPDPAQAWPLGFAGAPGGAQALASWLGADMTILLGTRDTDPEHPSLNREPGQMAQGPHRLARGQNFHLAGRNRATELGVPFGWSLAYAPGIAHDNGGMAAFAANRLYGDVG